MGDGERGVGHRRTALAVVAAALTLGTAQGVGPSAAVPAAAQTLAVVPATFLVGTAAVDITPTTPVTMAAYGTYRVSTGVQRGRPFMARSIAISAADGSMAHTVVLTQLDGQGYFVAYKEDPVTDIGHFGSIGVRRQVAADTGLDVEHVVIASTHTHNSPDLVGVWGGGEDTRNEAYLSVVREGTIRSIEKALAARRPARLAVGVVDARRYLDTFGQVRGDPATYPVDRLLRVLQARDLSGHVVGTFVNFAAHGTVLGPEPVISPDWPGEVATQLDARWGAGTSVVVPGGVGRTFPNFPDPHVGNDWERYLRIYGADVVAEVDAALARSRPVVDGAVGATGTQLTEVVTDPAAYPLLYSKTVLPGTLGGTMRSNLPPYVIGPTISSDLNALRVGDLFISGSPGEAYPEVSVELERRVHGASVCGDTFHAFSLSLVNDQVGYTTTTDEYALALAYGGDEGLFAPNPVFGNDVINTQLANARALGLTTDADYNGVTAGPLAPPPNNDNPAPPLADTAGPAPLCPATAGGTPATGSQAGATPGLANTAAAMPLPAAGGVAMALFLGVARLRRRRAAR